MRGKGRLMTEVIGSEVEHSGIVSVVLWKADGLLLAFVLLGDRAKRRLKRRGAVAWRALGEAAAGVTRIALDLALVDERVQDGAHPAGDWWRRSGRRRRGRRWWRRRWRRWWG